MAAQTHPGLSEAKKRLLSHYLAGKARTGNEGIPKRVAGEPVPQSLNQEQVWTHAHWIGNKPAYNELITIRRRGPLDVRALERTLDEMNRRHEIWRTTFEMGRTAPVQIIHGEAAPVKLRVIDLRAMPAEKRVKESERLAAEDARAPFRLTKLPLWRAILVRVADEEFQLHVNLHHLVMDGVTINRILLPELIAIYGAFSQGLASPLPEPETQYGDFAAWQRARLTDEALAPHLAWWKNRLAAPLPRLDWPMKNRPPVQTYNGATELLFLPSETVNPLRAFAERESATLFMGLAAGFFMLLHRYTDETDLIVGIPTAARTPETEKVMGYFLNMLPLRVDLCGNPGFREVLKRVRGGVLDALEHGAAPLLRILREAKPPMDPGRNPIFQIMMSLEVPPPQTDPSWDVTKAAVSSGSAKMDLYLNLDTRADGLMAPVNYNPDLLDAAGVRSMFADWKTILEAGVAEPDRPVGELRLKPTLAGRVMGWFKR